jgi:hypothetical protein
MPARTDRAIRADTIVFMANHSRSDPDNTIVDRRRLEWAIRMRVSPQTVLHSTSQDSPLARSGIAPRARGQHSEGE